MTVSQFLAQADSRELSEWFIYFEVMDEKAQKRRQEDAFERRITGGIE